MARYRDDGEVQIDNSTKVQFRNAFQQLIMIAALNVGTLLFTAMRCIFTSTYEIEANSEKEAIAKLLEDSQDFARQAEVEKIEDRPFSTTSPAPPWAVQRIKNLPGRLCCPLSLRLLGT